jgi:hypothetical protein
MTSWSQPDDLSDQSSWKSFKDIVKNNMKNVFFYLAFPLSKAQDLIWTSIIGLNGISEIAVNTIQFRGDYFYFFYHWFLPISFSDGLSKCVREEYDLQGMSVSSLTKTWIPYFSLEDCSNATEHCRGNGFYAELMDYVANKYVFSPKYTFHSFSLQVHV